MEIYGIRRKSTSKAYTSECPNLVTKQLGFALRKADFSVSAFQVIFDNHMLKHIQKCTNVEHQRIFEFHLVSSMHLWHCYMYEMRMGQKLSPLQFLD